MTPANGGIVRKLSPDEYRRFSSTEAAKCDRAQLGIIFDDQENQVDA